MLSSPPLRCARQFRRPASTSRRPRREDSWDHTTAAFQPPVCHAHFGTVPPTRRINLLSLATTSDLAGHHSPYSLPFCQLFFKWWVSSILPSVRLVETSQNAETTARFFWTILVARNAPRPSTVRGATGWNFQNLVSVGTAQKRKGQTPWLGSLVPGTRSTTTRLFRPDGIPRHWSSLYD